MSHRIGLIVEDKSDLEIIEQLTSKMISKNSFSFKPFFGRGCGKLRKKCNVWAKNLIMKGCKYLVIVHDLDENNLADLKRELENEVADICCDGHIILIPIQEIEAWLLSDSTALKKTFSIKKNIKVPLHPESLNDPKKELAEIIWKHRRIHYTNTIHNVRIASALSLQQLRKKCPSFAPYPKFISALK